MSDKLLTVKDNGLSGLAIQRIEAADAKTMLDVPAVDDTLSVSGAAADAKVTGDAISKINASVFDQKTVYPETTKSFSSSGTYLNIIAASENFTFEAGKTYYLTVKCTGLESAIIGDMTSYGFRTYKYENGSYTVVENLNTLFATGITALRNFVRGGEEKTVLYTPQESSNVFRLTLSNSTGGTDREIKCGVSVENSIRDDLESTDKRIEEIVNTDITFKTEIIRTDRFFTDSGTYLNAVSIGNGICFAPGKKYLLTLQFAGVTVAYGDASLNLTARDDSTVTEEIWNVFADSLAKFRLFVNSGEEKSGLFVPQTAANTIRFTMGNSTGGASREIKLTVQEVSTIIEEVQRAQVKHGKVIVNMGDSIFGKFYDEETNPTTISTMLADSTGAEVHNFAYGATHAYCYSYSGRGVMDFTSLADAIVSGNFDDQKAYAESTGNSYYIDRVNEMAAFDWTKVDCVTIGYGTNDFTNNYSIEYFTGAIKYGINKIQMAYPNVRFIIVTPIIRFTTIDGTVVSSDDDAFVNTRGLKLTDYVQACIDVGREVHSLVLDNYYTLGINLNNQSIFLSDKVHPTFVGRRIIANRVISAVEAF